MTEQEEKDLEAFKAAVIKQKLHCYDHMKLLSTLDVQQLKNAGYLNGTAEAVLSALKNNLRVVDKLTKDYLKKYPDDR